MAVYFVEEENICMILDENTHTGQWKVQKKGDMNMNSGRKEAYT
jgi:hypothetical protein